MAARLRPTIVKVRNLSTRLQGSRFRSRPGAGSGTVRLLEVGERLADVGQGGALAVVAGQLVHALRIALEDAFVRLEVADHLEALAVGDQLGEAVRCGRPDGEVGRRVQS